MSDGWHLCFGRLSIGVRVHEIWLKRPASLGVVGMSSGELGARSGRTSLMGDPAPAPSGDSVGAKAALLWSVGALTCLDYP